MSMPADRPPTRAVCSAASRVVAFAAVLVAAATSGASCPHALRGYQVGTMPLPRVLPPQPSLEQVIAAVHDNTDRVRSIAAPQAVLVVPGVPRLSARVACAAGATAARFAA